MEPSSVARAMLPGTSTALSAASLLKTSSRQPEKLGFVSKTVTRDICRTGLSWHSVGPPPRRSRSGQPALWPAPRDHPESLRVFGCLPGTGARGCTEAGVRKASREETAGGVRTDAGVDLWGICPRCLI